MVNRTFSPLWFTTLLIVIILFLPAVAFAQQTPVLDVMLIRIWPEYDQRAALVFLEGQVSPDTPIPVELTFILPDTATLNAAAYADPDGTLLNATFILEANTLSITSPNGTFHIEFYDSALLFDAEKRSYALDWTTQYAVETLHLEVQQPVNATNFNVIPAGGSLFSEQPGLNNYRLTPGPLAADETFTTAFSYDKADAVLTVDLFQTVPLPTPVVAPPAQSTGPDAALLISLAIVLAALIGAGAFLLGRGMGRPQSIETPVPVQLQVSAPAPTSTPAPVAAPSELEPEVETILTDRELEVLVLLAEGLTNREMGDRLGISPKTVARHRENMMGKLKLHSRTELVKYAIKIGLVDVHDE